MTKRTCWLFALVLALLSACGPSPSQGSLSGGPRSWIDSPLQGSTLPLAPIEVASRARHPAGVAQVELWVNGAVVARGDSPDPSTEVLATPLSWRPPTPGSYVLQVRAKSAAGDWGPFARADVTVTDEVLLAAADMVTATRAPTAVPTPTPTEAPTATVPPTETPVPADTPAAASAREHTSSQSGALAATATTEVVVVAVPTVSSGSALGGPTFSTADLYYGDGSCGPQQVSFEISALPGHDVTAVTLCFSLADQATGAATGWTSVPMARQGGRWTCTVGLAEIPGYSAYRKAWFQFYFVATDSSGGQSKSVGYYTSITLARCG